MDLLDQAKRGRAWPDAVTGTLRPGTTLGRYELILPVGIGGMACVWAARLPGYRGFSKLVAIKTVLPHLANHPDFENMLLDEARIAAELHHPNVCNLFDVGEDQGVLYLVLEWVNGDSLLHLLRGARPPAALDCRIAARIVADACAGLHAAHELTDPQGRPLGVVHRDVSPQNVLVSLDGTTKLADFGVAKAQGQLHQTTRAGEIRGKLAYMAPEQLGGPAIDRRADVFSMGCVLYHATTGQAPFRGESDARLVRAILEGNYEPPEQVATNYPPELATVVKSALSTCPEGRFETADRMRLALEAFLHERTSATPTVLHATTARDVGEVVRERIGAKLERRQMDVRAALEAGRMPESTRPVHALAPARESGVLRAAPVPARPGEHASNDGVPVRLLAAGDAANLRQPAPAGRRPLKMTMAIALGLLAAAAILQIRSLFMRPPVERARSGAMVAEPPTPAHAVLAALSAERPLPETPRSLGAKPDAIASPLATALRATAGIPEAVAEPPAAGRPLPSPVPAAAPTRASSPNSGRPPELPANPY
jgi:hypothetical protein